MLEELFLARVEGERPRAFGLTERRRTDFNVGRRRVWPVTYVREEGKPGRDSGRKCWHATWYALMVGCQFEGFCERRHCWSAHHHGFDG